VRQATALAAGRAAADRTVVAPMTLQPARSKAHCGFCGKQARKVQHLVAGESAAASGHKFGQGPGICNECLRLCEEILAESTTP
jgi:bacterioferritin-associated ferredoxin